MAAATDIASKDERTVSLKDGRRVVVRRIRPDDKDLLVEGLQRLSDQSKYLRFFEIRDHLSAGELQYLTEVDHRSHEAWGALDPDNREHAGLAVARYIELSDEPGIAEAAITVVDSHQGLGLGTLLLGLLVQSAIDNRIRALRAYVLPTNRKMLSLFEEMSAEMKRIDDGSIQVDIPLPETIDQLPDSPVKQALDLVAQG